MRSRSADKYLVFGIRNVAGIVSIGTLEGFSRRSSVDPITRILPHQAEQEFQLRATLSNRPRHGAE